ncbi:MAG: hypothetical protein B6226_02300 [Candidatus Cloacimonetes bacterium 4572_65]|nr:MAG: hypothetical protein B6226_02300 [Candidatus Cloacimonetes bacterium 4572_65]
MGVKDLDIYSMLFVYLLLLVPLAIIMFMKLGLVKRTLISTFRMSIQLGFIGVYLKYIFEWNNIWLNLGWLLVMALVSSFSVINSNNLRWKFFLLPILSAILIPLLLNILYFNTFIARIGDIFNAVYLIPVSGMLLGNTLRANIIATNSFVNFFKNREKEYLFTLSLGADRSEALQPVLKSCLTAAIAPTLASIATIGLVSLPGMMTGQILGGSIPLTAIKYQIAIMIAIFSTMTLSVFLLVFILKKIAFDKFDVFRKDIFR